MQTYYDVKDMLKRELDEITRTGELSAGSLDTVDKLLHAIKNACKVIMYEEYSEGGHSYADADMDMTDYSNARGRTGYVRRDSMGRYSRRGGYSYDSDHAAMNLVKDMMNEATSEEERRVLQKVMRKMERK